MKEMIVAYIRDNMGLDEEFAGELIDDYRSTITEYIGKAHAAIEASDAAGMRRIGHTIKGFSANIGAEPVRVLGLKLQEAGEAGDVAAGSGLVEEIEGAISAL
ncbi:Hpt domain-containing protein [Victivallis vadensis]|uniref:Hpt domain-containing protein n=1 Tax=Victivallis vadensis TaxID=172901 RepID=UPI0026DAC799|nr:Hpt domain-containing protein [Victivallis vadensis]